MRNEQKNHFLWILKKLSEKYDAKFELRKLGTWEIFPDGKIYELKVQRLKDRNGNPVKYDFEDLVYPSSYNIRELEIVFGVIRALLCLDGVI
jgi:hypothetical protein